MEIRIDRGRRNKNLIKIGKKKYIRNLPLNEKKVKFINEYLANGGNGTRAAMKAYDLTNYSSANSQASANLKRPEVRNAINTALSDKLLVKTHLALLNKRESIITKDGEEVVGKEIDAHAVSKGLDMAYKIKGYYAPEKHDVRQLTIQISQEMAQKYRPKKSETEVEKTEE